jgi:1,4-dihydroxy-2-naphthoate octaprenyltransferase
VLPVLIFIVIVLIAFLLVGLTLVASSSADVTDPRKEIDTPTNRQKKRIANTQKENPNSSLKLLVIFLLISVSIAILSFLR